MSGKEAADLVYPLRMVAYALTASGHLDDAYTVMMRALNVSEKHFGEDGLETCQLRTRMGEAP